MIHRVAGLSGLSVMYRLAGLEVMYCPAGLGAASKASTVRGENAEAPGLPGGFGNDSSPGGAESEIARQDWK